MGARNCKSVLAKAVAELRAGRHILVATANKYKINYNTILNEIYNSPKGNPGHPNVLTAQQEKLLADTLTVVVDWGVN